MRAAAGKGWDTTGQRYEKRPRAAGPGKLVDFTSKRLLGI